jgi:heme a synthase
MPLAAARNRPVTRSAPIPNPDKMTAALRPVVFWLFGCAAMVFAMAIIGAITRLTESGLSITEWKPITGVIPPLNESQWLLEFEKYRQIPEYKVLNRGMSLDEFKQIFFWEWFHRLWGRLIGVVFLIPFVWFWLRGHLDRSMKIKGAGLLLLGGLQGFIGWYMVQSGLVDRTDVSHYRLALHLGVAFIIYAALIRVALDLCWPAPAIADPRRMLLQVGVGLLCVTILWGAFVAGLDAGFAYNEWPLMNGQFAPSEMWTLSPAWLNLLENTAAVQFFHRWLAVLTALVLGGWCLSILRQARPDPQLQRLAHALAGMLLLQVLLGISTLLSVVSIPVAAAHQAGAFILTGLVVAALQRTGPVQRPIIVNKS